jgi:hypothetical protein
MLLKVRMSVRCNLRLLCRLQSVAALAEYIVRSAGRTHYLRFDGEFYHEFADEFLHF